MDLKSFERLVTSDTAAYRVIRHQRYKNGRVFCHGCGHRKVYRLAEGRYRCGSCRYAFGLLTGTWRAQSKNSLAKWFWLIKLFELEVTAHQAAAQVEVSYPTALRLFTVIRRSILAQQEPDLLRREVELDEPYFGGRHKGSGAAARPAKCRFLVFWSGVAGSR